jgi:hypothetical protein
MANALVKFDEIESKIKAQMKETFLNMIPEESWDRLAREYLGKNGSHILEPIMKEAMESAYKEMVESWVARSRVELEAIFASATGTTFAEACSLLGQNILNTLSKQTADQVLSSIQHGTKNCTCGYQLSFGATQCPRCNMYV